MGVYSGDLGLFDKHGYLYIKDRIDNMILVSGENITHQKYKTY